MNDLKIIFGFFIILVLAFLSACGGPDAPLNAETRQRIDSTSAAQIRLMRINLDSLCRAQRSTQLPILMDSIRKVRLREIEDKMKNIPH